MTPALTRKSALTTSTQTGKGHRGPHAASHLRHGCRGLSSSGTRLTNESGSCFTRAAGPA